MSKKQVLFFIGQDVTAHLVMNRVVSDMMLHGDYEPVLYYARNTTLKNANLPQLRDFGYYEKTLLNKVVYPFIEAKPSFCQQNVSPEQLAEKWETLTGSPLEYHLDVPDVNDPEFVATIRNNPNIACAVSVRCTQIFRPEIVAAVKTQGPFLNLHSGLLPKYRGVMPTLRRMFDIKAGIADDNNIGFTLHKVDGYDPNVRHKGIDTGKIIAVQSIILDPKHSGYQASVSIVEAGADAITDALKYLQKGRHFHEIDQPHPDAKYYTFPTVDELREWKQAGVVLVRPEDAITTLVNAFSKAGSKHGDQLEAALRADIAKYQAANCVCGVDNCGASDADCRAPANDRGDGHQPIIHMPQERALALPR